MAAAWRVVAALGERGCKLRPRRRQLLGASGAFGESWMLLSGKLVAAGVFDQVILIAAGVGATMIGQWAAAGDLNGMLVDASNQARPAYRITHVLWRQGENDFADGTSEAAYFAAFQSIVATLRAAQVFAPVYVSRPAQGRGAIARGRRRHGCAADFSSDAWLASDARSGAT